MAAAEISLIGVTELHLASGLRAGMDPGGSRSAGWILVLMLRDKRLEPKVNDLLGSNAVNDGLVAKSDGIFVVLPAGLTRMGRADVGEILVKDEVELDLLAICLAGTSADNDWVLGMVVDDIIVGLPLLPPSELTTTGVLRSLVDCWSQWCCCGLLLGLLVVVGGGWW